MEKHECFGLLDRVFPLGEQGLREITEGCFQCPDRISCLKKALSTEKGLQFRAGLLDRSPSSGFLAKIKRWSRKKELSRLVEQEKKDRK